MLKHFKHSSGFMLSLFINFRFSSASDNKLALLRYLYGLFFNSLTLFLVASIFCDISYLDFIQIYYYLHNRIQKGHKEIFVLLFFYLLFYVIYVYHMYGMK